MAENPADSWQIEGLRATAFPSPDVQFDPKDWWNSVLSEGPDSQVDNMKLGTKTTQGTFKGNKLTLTVAPGRVDWNLAPSAQSEQALISSITLESPDEPFECFSELILKWLPLSPVLDRIALGTQAMLPAESKAQTYRLLQSYLPAVKLDEDSSDFIYRINRPRESKSGIDGLRINRVSTWMSIMMSLGQFSPDPRVGIKAIGLGQRAHACRVELDINTAQEFQGQLRHDQSVLVFRELVESAREILRHGDQP